jgi:hypothetical protein
MDFDNKLKKRVYHGSNANFETPDPNKSLRGQYGLGFYTTTNSKQAKDYGENFYEYDLEEGNFFNPQTYQFNDQQKKILVDLYKQVAPKIDQKEINSFLKRLDDPVYRSYSENIINTLRYLGNSNDLKPILEKLGITNIQGLEVPFINYETDPNDKENKQVEVPSNVYVVFDPKTLKLINKTKK